MPPFRLFTSLCLVFLCVAGCMTPEAKQQPESNADLLPSLLAEAGGVVKQVMQDPERFELQILYTQIDYDADRQPIFTSHHFRVDKDAYFYPASTVKFPMALMALEKLKDLDLGSNLTMLTDSVRPSQTAVRVDSSAENGLPSVAHYVRKIFLVSDNDAFNRLYEFVGQGPLNKGLWEKGYEDLRIVHHLAIHMSAEENRHGNPVRLLDGEKEVYTQPATYNDDTIAFPPPILKGKGELVGDSVLMRPKDFASKNYFPLETQQAMLRAFLFPASVPENLRFDLREEDRQWVMKAMSQLPRDSEWPRYDPMHYYDSYAKFLLFGDSKAPMPQYIQVYNKIGLAYGYMTDNAYIVDHKNGVEFMLSTTLLVNENGIFNDGQYEYDQIGFPFLAELGRVIYEYELRRIRNP